MFASSTPTKTLKLLQNNQILKESISTEKFWSAAQPMNPKKLKPE